MEARTLGRRVIILTILRIILVEETVSKGSTVARRD
jgi:hypothetical protein